MIQVYCDDEKGVNKWLSKNTDKEIMDIKMALDQDGEYIMVIYKTDE